MPTTTKIITNDGPTKIGDPLVIKGEAVKNLTITNNNAESIQYSTNSGSSFTTLAAGGTASLGSGLPGAFRFRRANSGAYPLAIDATFDEIGSLDARFSFDASGNKVLEGGGETFPLGSGILSQSAMMMVVPSSGSIGNNGALTVTTALPRIIDFCFMYFPASAISAGSAAGWYYTVMSSTTVGIVYNNLWTGGDATVPATPTPFVTTGPGAYTQTVDTDITCANWVLPGGYLGANGSLVVYPLFAYSSSANSKVLVMRLANTAIYGKTNTNSAVDPTPVQLWNRGRKDRQVGTNWIGMSASGTDGSQYLSINTSVDQEMIITLKLTNATDFVMLQAYRCEVHKR